MAIIVTTTKKFNIELAKQTNRGGLLILEAFRHDLEAQLKVPGRHREGVRWTLKKVLLTLKAYEESLSNDEVYDDNS